jgi:hypothetical protein
MFSICLENAWVWQVDAGNNAGKKRFKFMAHTSPHIPMSFKTWEYPQVITMESSNHHGWVVHTQ